MAGFNTHGGYFSPKDYTRINEGGSHEENPNGGVQLGVDPEGNPNLLEEGEPVYKDYVYSDNITADKTFLEQNHLPGKYAGKLYSKIADNIFEEAEERPIDPISRKGLEVMLGRLADAQEGQKQAKEQRDLEDELAQLSLEELDQLEQMLAQGEQEQMVPEQVPMEASPEQMVDSSEPISVEGMPMMACGGKLRYDDGGFRFDPFLLKRYPDGPLSRAMWEYQHGDEPYPVTFAQRVKAAYDEQKLKSERENNQKQRKYEDSKFYRKLNEFDDKYLDNMWLHPYYEREVPLFPMFKKFDMGGPLTEEQKRAILEQGPLLDGSNVRVPSLLEMALGSDNKIVQGVKKAQDWMENSTIGRIADAVLPSSAMEAFAPLGKIGKAAKSAYTASDIAVQVGKWTDEVNDAQKAFNAAETIFKTGKDAAGNTVARDVAKSGLEKARKNLRFAKQELSRWSGMAKSAPEAAEAASVATESAAKAAGEISDTSAKTFNGKKLIKGVIGGGVGATGLAHGYQYVYKPIVKDIHDHRNQQPYIFDIPDSTDVEATVASPDTIKISSGVDLSFLDEEPEYKADGGKINKFPLGGRAYRAFMNLVSNYLPSRDRGGIEGKYRIDRHFDPYLLGNKNIEALEHDPRFTAFTNLVVEKAKQGNQNALDYLRKLDEGVADWTNRLFTPEGVLKDDWETTYRGRRDDGLEGIYHLIPNLDNLDGFFDDNRLGSLASINRPAGPTGLIGATRRQSTPLDFGEYGIEPNPYDGGAIDASTVTARRSNRNSTDASDEGPNLLPTFPRYAGAIGSGLLGLYDVFQEPDRYTAPRYVPQTPEGRIHLRNQVYNPIDQNMIANAQMAQANATNRALRNSGLGPSTAAAVLASDNNTTGNLGTGFIQAWDANNQRRNAVINANNAAETQRAQFDYNVDVARKQALNDAQVRNMQNNLLLQRLNYEAEGDKYKAISNQIGNGLQALSGIGQENFAINQINTNPAFIGYGTGVNGAMYYNPRTGRWERQGAEPRQAITTARPALRLPSYVTPFGVEYSTDPFMGYNTWNLNPNKKTTKK